MSSDSSPTTTIDVTNGHTGTQPIDQDHSSQHTTTLSVETTQSPSTETELDIEPETYPTQPNDELGEATEMPLEVRIILAHLAEHAVALRVPTTVFGYTVMFTDYSITDGQHISRIGHPRYGTSRWIGERPYQRGLHLEKITKHVTKNSRVNLVSLDDQPSGDER